MATNADDAKMASAPPLHVTGWGHLRWPSRERASWERAYKRARGDLSLPDWDNNASNTPDGTSPTPLASRDSQSDPTGGSLSGLASDLERLSTEFGPFADDARQIALTLRGPHDESRVARALHDLRRITVLAGLQQELLVRHGLIYSTYNHLSDYETNRRSPSFESATPSQLPPIAREPLFWREYNWTLFGQRVALPIGVSASPLTANSKWVRYYARHGYNVLTYKTVRSRASAAFSPPNWLFSAEDTPWPVSDGQLPPLGKPIGKHPNKWMVVEAGRNTWPGYGRRFSTANSLGIPSDEPLAWREDVAVAAKSVRLDQLLIVSVIGTRGPQEQYPSLAVANAALAEDYARTARWAAEALSSSGRLPIIELNLSAPNISIPTKGGGEWADHDKEWVSHALVCDDRGLTHQIVEQTAAGLRSLGAKLVIKLSYQPYTRLRELLTPIVDKLAGVSGINAVQCIVLEPSNGGSNWEAPIPAFERREAGVSGALIREYARSFARSVLAVKQELDASFEILGIGGVTQPEDAFALLNAGASAVQGASGPFYNPRLASDIYSYSNTLSPSDWKKLPAYRLAATRSQRDVDIRPGELPRDVGRRHA